MIMRETAGRCCIPEHAEKSAEVGDQGIHRFKTMERETNQVKVRDGSYPLIWTVYSKNKGLGAGTC